MKKTPRHVRLDPDIQEEVDKIAAVTGLAQVEVMRQMIGAGVKAIKANNYKLQLPLRLVVVEEAKNLSSSTSGSGGGVARKGMGDALGEAVKKKAAS